MSLRPVGFGVVLASAVSLLAMSANAADMYRAPEGGGYKDGPVYESVWAGFYAGVNGGYGWANSGTVSATASPGPITVSSSFSPEGGFGGGQIGYNWQRGYFVYGLEADIEGSGIKGSGSAAFNAINYANGSVDVDWFGTVRGRLGLTVAGSGLLYATGGFAFGGVEDKLSTLLGAGAATVSSSNTATGYVVGGGFEYLFSPKWSAKIEYQYIDLGSTSLSAESTDNRFAYTKKLDADYAFSTVRLGVNYHFVPSYESLK